MIKALIVDDEPFVRASLKNLFDWDKNGFALVPAANDGYDALERIAAHKPDIVITDIVMPGMDGFTLLETIKTRYPNCVSMVFSNLGEDWSIAKAKKLGAEQYCLKAEFTKDVFNKAMLHLKTLVIERTELNGACSLRDPSEPNRAGQLADALQQGHISLFTFPATLHVFCLRIREYASEVMDSFHSLYQSLSKIIMAVFGSEPSTAFVQAPWRDGLLITVEDISSSFSASDIMKKLDSKIRLYLQADVRIAHYSNTAPQGNESLFKKLLALAANTADKETSQLLYDDDIGDAKMDNISQVIQYIDKNIERSLSLMEIAEHVALNASYLSRLFKIKTNHSLVQYITAQKMKRAALLLRSGNYLVKETAALLGFDDPYYFSKLFYKTYHISPVNYMAGNAQHKNT